MEKKYIYDAFISYRHTELDKFVAENLHKQLEAFKLPGNVSKNKTGRTRIERVFRDKDELPLTNNLEDPIMQALQNSEYLIVICSPRLRESLWCKKEIETFIKMHGREKVLAVLIEGEPEESFPDELLYAEEVIKHPDGTEEVVKKSMEPLAADIRGKDKKAMLKAMRTEMLRLLAPMFSLNYDDLRQRHRERRMKRILTATCIGAAICLVFGAVSTAMALRIQKQKEQIEAQNTEIQAQNAEIQQQSAEIQAQSEEIQNQNTILLENQALVLAEESVRELEAGDRIGAINTAVTALTEYDGIAMPYTAEAQYALTESLHVYDTNSYIKPLYQLETQGNISFVKVSPNGEKMLTGDSAYNLVLWDLINGCKICTLTDLEWEAAISCYETECTFVGNDKVVCVDALGSVLIYSITEDAEVKEESALGVKFLTQLEDIQAENVYTDPEGRYLLVEQANSMTVYEADTWTILTQYELEENTAFSGDFFFDEEGMYLAFGENLLDPDSDWTWNPDLRIRFLNLQTGTCSPAIQLGRSSLADVCFADGRAFVLYTESTDDISYNVSHLFACAPDSTTIYWENTYEDIFASGLFRSYADGINRILMITTYDAYAIEREDGSLHAYTTVGSTIVGGAVYINSDSYILFTANGEYLIANGDTMETYDFVDLFQSHSQDVGEFLVVGNGFLLREYTDNKVTYYQYTMGSDVEAYEGEFVSEETDLSSSIEAINIAQANNLPKAELANYAFYNEDESLLGINYTNNTFELYRTSDMSLVCSVSDVPYNVNRFTGTDAAGNIYVSGSGYGYMLSPDFELLARIEGLVYVDAEANRLILKDRWQSLLTVPIYTKEELLAKAEAYVLR